MGGTRVRLLTLDQVAEELYHGMTECQKWKLAVLTGSKRKCCLLKKIRECIAELCFRQQVNLTLSYQGYRYCGDDIPMAHKVLRSTLQDVLGTHIKRQKMKALAGARRLEREKQYRRSLARTHARLF